MKAILTFLTILATCAIFAQAPKKMVLIPDYPVQYETKVQERILQDYVVTSTYTTPTYSQDLFVIGNFNRVNVIRPMIRIPDCTPDNNNVEYVKTTQFNPNKTLSEILRNK